ncbi:helix-turn-helix domain-containing protein [Sphingobacterium sp. SRCM116780]|uniref:helix-turn-helix domain-containing protein n=1 Tax=Sphingobacterium sp. SRCM116780 TaxID=2907623 RepID=UPI001F44DA61|nr:helix-turn-helix transcriptional regulator [Sphingobacterium sp. SRCM116780]UIR57331.1 helix-turn-helix domain-containing protein [Sphingobacterium sp. SRCM116780]
MEIFESKSIYRIEYELIKKVKELRLENGWSQTVLSDKMGFAETFVGKCESIEQPEKYNLRHLVILSAVFNVKGLNDFFPNGLPEDELIKIRYKKVPKLKADGTASKLSDSEIVEIVVAEEETKSKSNKGKS